MVSLTMVIFIVVGFRYVLPTPLPEEESSNVIAANNFSDNRGHLAAVSHAASSGD